MISDGGRQVGSMNDDDDDWILEIFFLQRNPDGRTAFIVVAVLKRNL